MTITVEANGKEFEFPEGTSQEAIGQAVDEYFSSQPSRIEERKKMVRGQDAAFMHGLDRLGSGFKQGGLEVAESIGLMPEGSAAEFTKMKDEEFAQFNKAFKEEFGDDFGYTVTRMTAELSPFLLARGGGKTALKRMLSAGGIGATAGFGQYVPEGGGNRTLNTMLSGIMGAGTAGLFEILPAMQNFAKKWMSRGINSTFAKEGAEISKRTGTDLKLSQLTGDARSEAIETIARSDSTGEMVARGIEATQSKQLKQFFKATLAKLKPDSTRFGKSIRKTFDTVIGDEKTGKGILGKRAIDAEKDFNAAFAASGGRKSIPLTNFNKALDDLIGEIADTAQRFPKGPQAARLKKLMQLKEGASKGNVDARELHNMIKQYGPASKGKGKIFVDEVDKTAEKGIAKKLYGALKDDANQAPELKAAMSRFKAHTDEINEIRESALGKIFGLKKGQVTSQKIEDAFMTMDDEGIRKSMQVLQRVDPDVKRRLQALYLQRRIKGASAWGQADVPNFSPESMLKLINSEKKSFFAVFDDPQAANEVLNGLRAAQRVMMFNNRTSGQTTSLPVKLAGVLASMDKTFVARLGAELATPNGIRKLVLNPESMKALQVISKPNASQQAVAAATAKLRAVLFTSEEPVEQEQ